MKKLRYLAVFSVSLYVSLAAFLYFFQENFIFHPMPVPENHAYVFEAETDEVWVDNDDGRLHGILFKSNRRDRGVVLYFKGNMGNVGHSENIAKIFLRLGFDVLSMDYRGSGKSTGPLSESRLLHDAELWYDWAQAKYDNQVRVVGYSLGTTFASHLAGVKQVAHTILFAPMRSIEEIGLKRFPFIPTFVGRYPLRSYKKLATATGSIFIYHGTADKVIPFSSGASLQEFLGDDDAFRRIEGANHYTIPYVKEVLDHIRQEWRAQSVSVTNAR